MQISLLVSTDIQYQITEAHSDVFWAGLFSTYEDVAGEQNPELSPEERRFEAFEKLKSICETQEALDSLIVSQSGAQFIRDDAREN